MWEYFYRRSFKFRAERLNIAQSEVRPESDLHADASNLPTVLNYLSGVSTHAFNEYCKTVRRILPNVAHIQAPLAGTNPQTARIQIWSSEADSGRPDLSVPLSSCGTGVSQVMALVYVLHAIKEPTTIIIDEPNSFLHPAAATELMELLKENDTHQFIIATHAPQLIDAFEPEVVLRLSLEKGVTNVHEVEASDVADQRAILVDVGVRLSAVFGAEHILWVEGRTEEAACQAPRKLTPSRH